MQTISPRELYERRQRGETAPLLDVRSPAEHAEVHVPGVHLVPLHQLDGDKLQGVDGFAREQPLYILCHSGQRAMKAAEALQGAGWLHCTVVEGGTQGWADAGLPVERGAARVISIERQVRMAAGAIVLTGVLLSQLVHPLFVWLSAFVGAGLIFAGLTDWCGMGLLLARAPWNQRRRDTTCGSERS
jgi:rhodanese-related sulfurtransferase